MRYLILSDVHANWQALEAVLHHVRRKRYDRVVFLGDAVGYGASPNRVLEWLRTLRPPAIAVRGNHDRVCAGLDSGEFFNSYALQAARWTLDRLEPRNLDYLRELPEGPVALDDDTAICHGSAADEDSYIFSAADAHLGFRALPHRLVFFGHTHVPSLFTQRPTDDGAEISVQLLSGPRLTVDLEAGCRYLLNPGSVGQPRDRDPRAAYALYDDVHGRVHVYRVSYRAASARRRIVQAGLPPILGDRLLYGA